MSDMQIVKVVVRGELPDCCARCSKRNIRTYVDGNKCGILLKIIDNIFIRPSWCPLELEPSIHEYTAEEMLDDLGLLDDMEGENV